MGRTDKSTYTDRIDLHLVNCTARESLAEVHNGWLYTHERDQANDIARDGADAECERFLLELEERCSSRLAMWRRAQ